MREYTSLKILDWFKFAFIWLGIDYPKLRRIVHMKLTLDGRRIPTVIMQQRNNQPQEHENAFLKSLWVYGLMGIFLMMFMFMGGSPYIRMSFYFGGLMFVLTTAMIADFSTVLLEVKDKTIISTKPIDAKTVNIAKLVHIFIYLAALCGVLAGPGIVAALIRYGFTYALLMVASVVLITLLTILFTSLLYTILLKYFDGEKLKDVITAFQIVLSILVTVGYQLIGRMFRIIGIFIVFTPKWWSYLVPPVWFSAPFCILVNGRADTPSIVFTALAITVPIMGLILHLRVIAPQFEQSISKIASSDRVVRYKTPIYKRLVAKASKVISNNQVEQAFIKFSHVMLTKERAIKLKLYPGIALGMVFPVIMIALSSSGKPLGVALESLRYGRTFLYLYITAAMLAPSVNTLDYSDNSKGAWIYKTLPIPNPGEAVRGATKGYVLSCLLPPLVVLCIFISPLLGLGRLIDLIIVCLSSLLALLFAKHAYDKRMPFSEAYVQAQSSSAAIAFLIMGVIGGFAGIHAWLLNYRQFIYGYALLLAFAVVSIWRTNFKYGWEAFSETRGTGP